ncbi:monocarboxylate transporter 13-like, partial [Patiria miniata]|uniref:Major facilitator superfamily (MFS) profile domain-containing protein n=1 Tax=Patiria miniata TaxID=46514 RepID=A0A913Z2C9_PATMI
MINGSDKSRQNSWRWMILFSRFLWSFIALGKFKAMGVLLPHIVVSFSTSTAVAGFVTSASVGIGTTVCGPLAGAALKVWSPRTITMVGGAVVGTATIAGSLATSTVQLGVLFSVSSIGLAFIQVAMTQTIMDYFPDDFAFANGVTLAGGTIGMMVLPPLVDYLVFLYGWRNALVLTGALCFNYVACGALLRPLGMRYSLVPSHADEETELPMPGNPINNGSSDSKADPGGMTSVLRRVSETLRERLDIQALTQPTFVMFQVATLLEGMIFSMWHLFLIPQGIELGFGDSPSAFLATYAGIGSLIGRLSHGLLVDLGLIKASTLFILAGLVFAVPNLLDPLAVSSYTA